MDSKVLKNNRLLQKRIADLSPEKRAILEKLLATQSSSADLTTIKPRDRRFDPPPLSFAQQQLWFLDQLAPGNWFYNETSALQLPRGIDIPALEWSINELIRRHESLRTSFSTVNGEPVQIIAAGVKLAMTVVDLRALPRSKGDAEARALAAQDAQTPFDLTRSPLMRATLLRLADDDAVLVLTLHHITFDGWSFTILLKELSGLYEARAEGRPSPLPEPTLQYADYAVWQRKWLRGETLENELSYWRKQLMGLRALELPTDRPRPAIQRFCGSRCSLALPKSLCAAMRALSLNEGLTQFMTLLTAFKALLLRYSGQDDIVVGVPVANRHRAEIEAMIGFFVNTLVMRTDLSGDPTFREALGRVRKVTLEAFAHQDLPFEKLVEELHPERDLSRNPLFQVTFQVYGNAATPAADDTSIEYSPQPWEVEACTAKFDLRFDLSESGDGLAGFLEYDTDLFDRETIERMARRFTNLLASAIENPDQRLSELPILSDEERRTLLFAWNTTSTRYERNCTIHELFERQAAETPDATALVFGSANITYGELNRRANQLAHKLRALGVQPDTLVGISSERSIEMIVGLLGIVKAGGAYLPLDLDEPRDRLAFIAADAGLKVVITNERQLFHLSDRGVHVIPLALEQDTLRFESDENPGNGSTSGDLAYVMYTSGSTGKPKGVCVSHRSVVRLVRHTNYFNASNEDVFLHVAPLAFDASTFEIWGPLLNGAKVVIFPPYIPSLPELAQTIYTTGITVLWLTSALFHRIVDDHLQSLSRLKHLLAGGDVLSSVHVRKVLQQFPEMTLTNGYGPTENTTFTCTYSVKGPTDFGLSFPIGRPISNTRVYVLDQNRKPVPVGIPGELFIAGEGLARGYLNRPELTAERFIPDPFSAEPGDRMYRTGDVVRYRPGGILDFIGRVDNQVKIRGFRVELEEIEAVLREHPAVRDAVCMVWEQAPGDKRLIATVAADDNLVTATDLRRLLQQRLPEYMTPSSFIIKPELPVTANGKVDRRALTPPDHSRPNVDSGYVAPNTDTERVITAVWQEVLGLDKVGVNDNFFDLGGHSLLVVMVHNRLTEMFMRELSIVDLFRYPTVSSLSKLLNPEETLPSAARAQRQSAP